jgi:kynurenine formamidase
MAVGLPVILIMVSWENILGRKIIDLTLTFAHGKRGVKFEAQKAISSHGFNTSTLHIYSHALTHMDATKHFLPDGLGIEKIDLNKCVGEALVVDLSHKAPNSIITINDLESIANAIQSSTRVLFRTDWGEHADQDDYRTHFPRISAKLAQWLVDKGVLLIGLETPSVASLRPENLDELTQVHQILLMGDVIIVEGLTNLKLLPNTVEFVALPLKLENIDGSPVRAIAIIDDN